MPLADHRILIAGGSHSVGMAIAERAMQQGARIVFSPGGPSDGPSDSASPGEGAGAIRIVRNAMRTEADIERLIDDALETLKELHVLILNISAPARAFKAVADLGVDEWNQRLFEQLTLPFFITRRVIEEFVTERKAGRIVYLLPEVSASRDCASTLACQSALLSFMLSITQEYGRRGIACNAVIGAPTPDTVLFLGSEESSFTNGEVIRVHGS